MLRQLDRSNARAAFFLLIALAAWVAFLAPGCPLRVDPATEAVCPSRPNCGQCSSEAVCVWCPGSSSCVGASERSARCDIETVISVPESCPENVGAVDEGEGAPISE